MPPFKKQNKPQSKTAVAGKGQNSRQVNLPTVKIIFTNQWKNLSFSFNEIPRMLKAVLGPVYLKNMKEVKDGHFDGISFNFVDKNAHEQFLEWIATSPILGGTKVMGGLESFKPVTKVPENTEFENQLQMFIESKFNAETMSLDLSNLEITFFGFFNSIGAIPAASPNLNDRFFCQYLKKAINLKISKIMSLDLSNNMLNGFDTLLPLDGSESIEDLNLQNTFVLYLGEYKKLSQYCPKLLNITLPSLLQQYSLPQCPIDQSISYISQANSNLSTINNQIIDKKPVPFDFVETVNHTAEDIAKVSPASLRLSAANSDVALIKFFKNLSFAFLNKDAKLLYGLIYSYLPGSTIHLAINGTPTERDAEWHNAAGDHSGIENIFKFNTMVTPVNVDHKGAVVINKSSDADGTFTFTIQARCFINKEPITNPRNMSRTFVCLRRGDFLAVRDDYIEITAISAAADNQYDALVQQLVAATKLNLTSIGNLIQATRENNQLSASQLPPFHLCMNLFEEFKSQITPDMYQ